MFTGTMILREQNCLCSLDDVLFIETKDTLRDFITSSQWCNNIKYKTPGLRMTWFPAFWQTANHP